MRKSSWLVSAAILVLASPAVAQTAQSSTDTDKQGAQPTDGATAETAAVSDQARVQEPVDTGNIIITATRRNQALSDVPMAVSAVTAESLKNSGATDIRQLVQLSPSLLVSSTSSEGGAAVARIRGVGTVGDNPGLESSVGLFIDGVYRSRTASGLTELGPIDRIEVLRGPQGTLFGRNTSAGLISVITAKPQFTPSVYGQLDLGNYNFRRIELGATGPISESIAARLDGVYVKRDGFITNSITGERVNDRDRWLLRGQLLFQPSSDLSFRLIGDFTNRDETCCAAPYLPASDYVVGTGRQPSTVKPFLQALGAVIEDDPFARKASWTEGYGYQSKVRDGGVSGELSYEFGNISMTSITAYRYNKYTRGTDADYNNLDILHRAPDGGSYNRYSTFSQELRFNGTAGPLDWLVGGYYANEDLQVRDNLEYGSDYEKFANCLLFQSIFPAAVSPSSPTCVGPALGGTLAALQTGIGQVQAGIAAIQAAIANPATPPEQIPALQAQLAALRTQLATLSAQFAGLAPFNANPARPGFGSIAAVLGIPGASLSGAGIDDLYNQKSNNIALFTHNIISVTDQLKLTIGARYTHERKTLNANFSDNNDICRALAINNLIARGLPTSLAGLQRLPCFNPAVPTGFNPGASVKSENNLSGTVVLSYKPTDRLLTYASYSRGYKAGGFNLDRAGLARQQVPGSAGPVLATATLDDLQFKPETNDAFELGAKYHGRGIDVNVAAFHQVFKNFQLNTFDGTKFIVENINACADDLNGADIDNNPVTGACSGTLRPGVRSQGVEVEVFARPMTDLGINLGATVADTRYRRNLVGADGKALTNALFQLPDRRLSNSSEFVGTASFTYNPLITDGLRALFYADMRYQSSLNTGSDLDLEKVQKAFTVVNARVGIQSADNRWALELWAQNLFNQKYLQVAFDAFAQGSGTQRGVEQGFYTRSTQLFGAFLGEPRTFGATLRGKLGFARAVPPPYIAPPAPPPPPAMQTCADGSMIAVGATCPPPPPPPPPPPLAPVERGERG
ncbi:MAG: TonB-dependent receptor [Sphingomicrobium sp.]